MENQPNPNNIMTTGLKVSLAAIIVLLSGILLYNIFGVNKTLQDAISTIKASERLIDTAQQKINASKLQLDSLRANIDSFRVSKRKLDDNVTQLRKDAAAKDKKFQSNLSGNTKQIDALNNAKAKALHPIAKILPLDTLQ